MSTTVKKAPAPPPAPRGGAKTTPLTGPPPPDQQLRDALHARGQRWTPEREHVLAILSVTREHLSAAQVHQRMTAAGERTVDLVTVYRALTALQGLGLVHEVSIFAQAARFGLSNPPHHHAICTACATIAPLAADQRTVALLHAAARPTGYQFSSRVDVHVYGLCPTCQASP